jgi:LAO/AO transport system kinase
MILAQDVLDGNRLALARLLTHIENETPDGRAVLNEIFAKTGHAHLIGVTGAPGTGKSTLVNQLARYYRNSSDGLVPKQVAIVAIDPSSPFSGGAVLGDRVRMRDLAGDPGVFIRSMASRGSLGGLATATSGALVWAMISKLSRQEFSKLPIFWLSIKLTDPVWRIPNKL